jgi:serine/threonine-protein kinase
MGAVYEVLHEITRHRRALKLLHPALKETPGSFERFLREASAAGRIGDAHIVDTFDAGETETGDPYVIMELLEGEPLTSVIARHPNGLPIPLALDLVIQACDGVGAAHRAGIIHRDLKPDNLFVVRRDGRPFVKVIDFGISKFEGTDFEKLTQTGFMMGTPLYMPVEQLGGQPVDERADVYALGVILYKSLSGKTPYSGTTLLDLAMKMTAGIFEPITTLRPDVPPALEALIRQVLSKAKEHRPVDAYAFAAELRAIQSAIGADPNPSLPPASAIGALGSPALPYDSTKEAVAPPASALGPASGATPPPASPTSLEAPAPGGARVGLALGAAAALGVVAAIAVSMRPSGDSARPTSEATTASVQAGRAPNDSAPASSAAVIVPSQSTAAAPEPSTSASTANASTAAPTPPRLTATSGPGGVPPTPPTTPASKPPGAKPAGGLATDNPYR